MKLETFFEKFELFADAPNVVAKMRELVLELAVRGHLSERRRADQTDATWRSFLASRNNGPGIQSLAPYLIPNEWRWVTLNDLGSCRVRNELADTLRASFVPMAMIPTGYGEPVRSESRLWGDIKKSFTHFAEGDVVLAKITPCFENGKSAVMRGLVNGVGAGTTELHVFRRTGEIILPEYVLLYIKSRGFISRGEVVMTGTAGQKRVPRDYFAQSPFPLPPPAEQKRIVAKVDELMALVDKLEAQLGTARATATNLLAAAVAELTT